ncbi:hypothetical protein [Acuticoccus sediminis]|uniref:hypothetical protein n=1 Tax=Acuticoccus sediminis TaxID=2184697 RepID=UPI001CFEB30F|nr:hypothetical protein [Acuticoccus sediminis]
MIDRITSTPPKSPIGLCLLSDGTPYDNYDVDYSWISPTSAAAFSCPEGKSLYHSVSEEDHGRSTVRAFCYTSRIRYGGDEYYVDTDKSAPEQFNFETAITVEPGSDVAYSSGVLNTTPARGTAASPFTPTDAAGDLSSRCPRRDRA